MRKLYIVGHIGSPLIGQAVAELHAMGHENIQVVSPEEKKNPFEPEPMKIELTLQPEPYRKTTPKSGQQLRRERRKGKKNARH